MKERGTPSFLAVTKAIGLVTYREVLRDKLLYNALLVSMMLFGAALLAGRLTFTKPERVVLDFGVAAINLACAAISILVGSSILIREIERRTIFVALAHPISRLQFLTGKFLGLAAILGLNWLLLCACFLAIFHLTGDNNVEITPALVVALLMSLLQSWVLAAIALLFSTMSTAAVSSTIGIGIFLLGNNVSQMRFIADKDPHSSLGILLKVVSRVVPNFENFNLGTLVTYGLPVPGGFLPVGILSAAAWIALCLFVGGLLLKRREL